MQRITNKVILDSFKVAIDSVAKAFGSNCEVVLHDLENVSSSIIRIANSHVTGRTIGSPLTDLGIEILKKSDQVKSDVVGPYFTKLDDGRTLKCVTAVIRNTKGKPVGMLCINIDLSFPLPEFAAGLTAAARKPSGKYVEHFALTPRDLISRTYETVKGEVNKQRRVSPSEKNKLVVLKLYKRGIFNVKGAIDFVAKEMGVSRYTVYNHLREAKNHDD